MKNILKGLLLAGVLGMGILIGLNLKNEKVEKIELKTIEYQSKENLYLEDGDIYFELTDGSWGIINKNNNEYIFQPYQLGDWDYNLDNFDDYEKLIKTYMEIE